MHVLKIGKVWEYSFYFEGPKLEHHAHFLDLWQHKSKKTIHVHFSFFALTLTPKVNSWTCNNLSPKSQWIWGVFIFVIRLFTLYTYTICSSFTPFWKSYYFQFQTLNLLLSISKLILCTSCLSPWKWCNLWLFFSSHKVILCVLFSFFGLAMAQV
jgi:hypothetical protein